jgi:hypothetical protein
MVTQGASEMLLAAAILLASIGVAVAGTAFGERFGGRWTSFSWAVSAVLLVYLVVRWVGVSDDLASALDAVATGIVVPAWAVWLGLGWASPRTAAS